ncbi:Transcription elongation factor spt6 [Actinomortierella wolfii]|nr:Transcription elongation factor spt6 [Actinomortierella wolfii]
MSDDDERRRRRRRDDDSDEEGEDVEFASENDEDSEEEEEDDEDELRKEGEGFIVDDDEEEEEDYEEVVRRKKKKKRRIALEEDLDEEDLDLMEENTGIKIKRPEKFKRLKRRRDDEEETRESKPRQSDLLNIFNDEEDDMEDDRGDYDDEMDHFIDDDEDEDERDDDRRDRREKAPVKPRARRAPIDGLGEDVWAEWYEVFGDGEDYAYALVKENGEDDSYYDTKPEPRLKDVFEPGVLAERMMTDTDEIIRVKDIPERMQLRPGIEADRQLTTDEIEGEEAYWVLRQLNESRRGIDQPPFEYNSVKDVLKFMSNEMMEVPFIETHRRDYFTKVDGQQLTQLLSREDLWSIYDLDLKFRSFLERRESLKSLMKKMDISDSYVDDMLLRAERLEELSDVSDYINQRYGKQIDKTKAFKRPGAGGSYDPAKRAQLDEFIKAFGLTASQFGANLLDNAKLHFPDDIHVLPEEAAQPYVALGFRSAERVVTAAVHMIAQEIAVDPRVRKALRSKYETAACVTVTPTEKGETAIDELHPYYPFKRLSHKSVGDFHDAQFLQIVQAVSEGLVKMTIKLPEEDTYLTHISDFFLSDNYSETSQKWNDLRRKILQLALKDNLFVLMERWMTEKLRLQAEDWVVKKCQMSLEEKLNVAPFVSKSMKPEQYPPRVVAVSHGAGTSKDATQIVFLDDNGKFADHMKVDTLRDEASQKAFQDFLDKRRPDVVVVGGFSVMTRRLVEQVEKVVNDLRDLRGDDVTVLMTNDETARLFQNSRRAIEEFPDALPLTRYCISLGRYVQNPMNEYAAMGSDLLNIRHHPLQHLVTEERLRDMLDRALVNIINSVGIDINEVVASPYKAHMLQYICGLGPRKAQSLIKAIESDDHNGASIDKRADLVIRKLLTWNIFMNCCSFIRVRSNMNGDILDNTRIHSEDYTLARKMAADALEIDEEGLEEYDNASQHVEELMRDDGAEKLNDLLLEDYAMQLEKIQNKPKRMTLETIKLELQQPFKDPRRPFERASPDLVFTMLTGETEQTLREGFIVPVLVTKVRDRNAMLRLDCGVDGILAIQNAADGKVGSMDDVVKEGQTLQAKVLRLDKEKFFADMSIKESDLRRGDLELRQLPVDRMFDREQEEAFRKRVKASVKKATFIPRKITHPLFKNINAEAAIQHLKDRPRGELVIRPSTRGADHLSITVKIAENLYKHYDVLELDKKDDYSLGKTLKIDGIKYSDLDELLVSHMEAIQGKIDALMASPKYKEDSAELRQSLETATKAKPGAAVYGFTPDRKAPGFFTLMVKLGANRAIEEWHIKVQPEHYVLRGPSTKECKDVVTLTNSFKEMAMNRSRPKQPSVPVPLPTRGSSGSGGMPMHISSGGHIGAPHQPMGGHHYMPHQPPPHMMHQAMPPVQPSWGTPWGGAPWTGAPGGHMQGGHMTGPSHGGQSSHDGYGMRSSRAPPTPRRFMPPPHNPYY